MLRIDNRLSRRSRSLAAALTLALSQSTFAVPSAQAGDAKTDASEAYKRGQKAFGLGDYHQAAEQFALADEIGPNPVALESAIKAAILAGDPALSMMLAERSTHRPAHAGMESQADRARAKYESAVGRVTLRCPEATACSLRIRDEVVPTDEPTYMVAGPHVVEVSVGDQQASEALSVPGGGELDWRAPPFASANPPPGEPPPAGGEQVPSRHETKDPDPPAKDDEGGGISPVWFFVGAGLTVAAAVPAIVFGADASSLNDDFLAGDDGAEDPGRGAQTRANVLWGVTGALGVATVLVGVFAVDWSGDDGSKTSVGLSPNGVFLRGTL